MKTILCLSESDENVLNFVQDAEFLFFAMEPLDPADHSMKRFENIFSILADSTDLSQVDLVIAENIEAIPLVYFMRKAGYFCPAIFIPHTNAYPLNILFYFMLVSELAHPDDRILCGSQQAAKGYQSTIGMRSLPICTFGIKNSYQKGDRAAARQQLGLPLDKKILLYTGRFMNDKGLAQLCDVYEIIKNRREDVLLVLCISHIDPHYYNWLAPRLRDAVVFYRLEKQQMLPLYQSADLFVSLAVSIFETYGKSPMEAIACGVPAVLPNWDGFRYYIHEGNGSLAKVNYVGFMEDAPFSFAQTDTEDYANKCSDWLDHDDPQIEELPEWAYYDHTMKILKQMTKDLLSENRKFQRRFEENRAIDFSKYPEIVKEICHHYHLSSVLDLEMTTENQGLISRDNPGDLGLLNRLHDFLFKVMDTTEIFIRNEQDVAK